MVYEYHIDTEKSGFTDITGKVSEAVSKSGIKEGMCIVYCPHTTSGITVNENADPDVVSDLMFALDRTFPQRKEFLHMEGNSPAHLKSSFTGCQQTFIVKHNSLLLGTWQGIYFCEFDGPRKRKFYVKIMGDHRI